MKITLSIFSIACYFMMNAQPDTLVSVQTMPATKVISTHYLQYPNPLEVKFLTRKDLLELQPEDVGQVLQKFSGISMKNYGGIGGLKTFSFRSLGSQHTATTLDGFQLQNNQSGQLNLGQIQTSNLEYIALGNQNNSIYTPVSVLAMANQLSLGSFEGNAYFNTQKIRLTVNAGSFGQSDNYLAYHWGKDRLSFTVYGKYRRAEGDYPYVLKVGNYNYEGTQRNNKLEEVYSGFSFFYRPTELKKPIRLMYRNSFIDQGLPGAVVLYNNSNQQYLKTKNHTLALDWSHKWGLTEIRYYSNYQYNEQQYLDSSYLNSQGYLEKNYYQNNAQLGWRFNRSKFGDLFNFYGGLEQSLSLLNFSDGNDIKPKRWMTSSSAGFLIHEKKYSVDMRVSYQLVQEIKTVDSNLILRHILSPFLTIQSLERGKNRWKMSLTTSTTSRLPSFNELYYAQVGNQNLEPERAQQIVLSNGFSRQNAKWVWRNSTSAYFNRIQDKILSIPTKNLFIWSIQNIGLVHALGADLNHTVIRHFQKEWSTELTVNYSYQRSIDRSNKENPTFGQQIAYIPEHTGNFDIDIRRKYTGFRFSSNYVGTRYSLNENIASNRLDPILILDASLFHTFNLKHKKDDQKISRIRLHLQVKNLMNQNYTYVKSFVMPGRNYLISLSYEI